MSIGAYIMLVPLAALYALIAYVVIEDCIWRSRQRKFTAKQRTTDLTSPEGRERLGLSHKERNPQ